MLLVLPGGYGGAEIRYRAVGTRAAAQKLQEPIEFFRLVARIQTMLVGIFASVKTAACGQHWPVRKDYPPDGAAFGRQIYLDAGS